MVIKISTSREGIGHTRMFAHLAGEFYVGLDHQVGRLLGDDHGHAEIFDGRHESKQGAGKDRGKTSGKEIFTKVFQGLAPKFLPASSKDSSIELNPERVIRKT